MNINTNLRYLSITSVWNAELHPEGGLPIMFREREGRRGGAENRFARPDLRGEVKNLTSARIWLNIC